MAMEIAPLKASFMFTGILGFLISVIYLPKYSLNWAFAFGLVFFIMIINYSLVNFDEPAPTIS